MFPQNCKRLVGYKAGFVLKTLERKRGPRIPDSFDVTQLGGEKTFIALGAVDSDLDKAIKLARGQMHLEHFGNTRQFDAQAIDIRHRISLGGDVDQHDVFVSQQALIDICMIAFDVPRLFEPLHTLPALTGRQAHNFAELGVRDIPFGFKLVQNPVINGIEVFQRKFCLFWKS